MRGAWQTGFNGRTARAGTPAPDLRLAGAPEHGWPRPPTTPEVLAGRGVGIIGAALPVRWRCGTPTRPWARRLAVAGQRATWRPASEPPLRLLAEPGPGQRAITGWR